MSGVVKKVMLKKSKEKVMCKVNEYCAESPLYDAMCEVVNNATKFGPQRNLSAIEMVKYGIKHRNSSVVAMSEGNKEFRISAYDKANMVLFQVIEYGVGLDNNAHYQNLKYSIKFNGKDNIEIFYKTRNADGFQRVDATDASAVTKVCGNVNRLVKSAMNRIKINHELDKIDN